MSDTVIIGIGNPLCGDDGVGIALLETLTGRVAADCVDAGTSAMQVVHALAGRRRALLLDCARMGLTPGDIRRFTLDDIADEQILPRLSMHEGDLLTFLTLARQLGDAPASLVLFGIEPDNVEMGMALSPAITARLDEYLAMIETELATATKPSRSS